MYKELCYLQDSSDCYDNLLKYIRVLEIPDYEYNEIYIKNILSELIREKVSQTQVTSVLISTNVDTELATVLAAKRLTGVYINLGNIYVNPEEISNEELIAQELSTALGGSLEEYKHLIRKRELRYVPILNKISLSSAEEITNYIDEENQALRQGILEKENTIGGFMILTSHPQRIYPE